MRPNIAVSPPRRAAANAWLLPFPPGAVKYLLPMIVSLVTGIRGATATTSMFKLPITTILATMFSQDSRLRCSPTCGGTASYTPYCDAGLGGGSFSISGFLALGVGAVISCTNMRPNFSMSTSI